jgi:prepilin-type N-terminal cleavage/methylation domain-containing protein/prepilin-type processing-associated H-X9-DG protein
MRHQSRPRFGFTLTELLVVIAIISVLMAIVFPAIQKVRAAADRLKCAEQMRELGIALHHYHVDHQALPPGCASENSIFSYPYASWLTRLLPYVEMDSIWTEAVHEYSRDPFFLATPPHKGLERIIPLYLCPSENRKLQNYALLFQAGFTCYLGVSGTNQDKQDGVMFLDSRVRLTDIKDGTSNTVMVGERPPSAFGDMGWWYAGWGQAKNGSCDSVLGVLEINRYWNAPGCPPGPYAFGPGNLDNQCDAFHFWSLHTGGANFLFADGSVHFLPYAARDIMSALSTRSGGESVTLPD